MKRRIIRVKFKGNEIHPKGVFNISRGLAIGLAKIDIIKGSKISNIGIDNSGNYISFDYNNQRLTFKDGIFNGDIAGVFFEETYSRLHIKDRIVLDIGANIGDTAIYFALNGAKLIYAFEPFPYSYKILEYNVSQFPLKTNIITYNAACGPHGTVKISPEYVNDERDELKEMPDGVNTPSYSLNDLIALVKLEIKLQYVLKMDCEGCEYDLILEASNEDLNKFSEIMVEYHYGYTELKNKLERAGFIVWYQNPSRVKNPRHSRSGYQGLLYAYQSSERS